MSVVVLVNDSSLRSFPSLPSFSSSLPSLRTKIRFAEDMSNLSLWHPRTIGRPASGTTKIGIVIFCPTYLLSKFPAPSLQNPNAQIPNTAPKIAIPPGPLVGKLRLYLIVSYPPAGGISLLISPSPYLSNRASRVNEHSLSESVRHVCLLS